MIRSLFGGARFPGAGLWGARTVLLVALSGVAVLSCARRADVPTVATPAAVVTDTVRGTLELIGNLPLAQLIVRWGMTPSDAVAVSGPAAESLGGLTGLEVMVRGHYGDSVLTASPAGLRGFVAEEFVVRAGDNGVAAHDGVVANRGGRWVLIAADGAELPAPFLPDALRHQEGTRVYLLGPLNAPPVGHGVVRNK